MTLKAYRITRDGESGEWHRTLLGIVEADDEHACRIAAIRAFFGDSPTAYGLAQSELQLFPIGERVTLSGRLSRQGRNRQLRSEFADMGPDEQEAYHGD